MLRRPLLDRQEARAEPAGTLAVADVLAHQGPGQGARRVPGVGGEDESRLWAGPPSLFPVQQGFCPDLQGEQGGRAQPCFRRLVEDGRIAGDDLRAVLPVAGKGPGEAGVEEETGQFPDE